MNIRNVPLLVAALLCPAVSSAVCPTEKSTVFYLNGVGVNKKDTELSRQRLSTALSASTDSRIRSGCVTTKAAYNYSASNDIPYAGVALDLVEALLQKNLEAGRNFVDATRSLYRLDDAAWIDGTLEAAAVLAGGTTYLIDNQIAEHLAAYELEAQTSGTLILAAHSQGNYYSGEEWRRLSSAMKSQTHLVAVATPTTSVVDGGPHVTLAQDNWAAGVFAFFGALRANVSNTEPCIGNFSDRWNCHGWKESYMNGMNSRNLIVNDIIALLPTAPIDRIVFSQLNGNETISRPNVVNGNIFNEVHYWGFQNLDSFTGTLNTLTLRTRTHSETGAVCNYSSRVKVAVFNGNGFGFASSEQNITPAYENYVFDFSSYSIPLASSCAPGVGCSGLYYMRIEPIMPVNACQGWYYSIDIAGVNSDVSIYTFPIFFVPESFPADPYIVVTGR